MVLPWLPRFLNGSMYVLNMGLFGKPKQKNADVEQLTVLLDKFEYADIERLCKDIICQMPESSNERPERIHLLEFIWKKFRNNGLTFQQVKDFAIKEGIVTQSFFE